MLLIYTKILNGRVFLLQEYPVLPKYCYPQYFQSVGFLCFHAKSNHLRIEDLKMLH